MTEPLHQVITRIRQQLDNDWPVDKEDIELLLEAYKSEHKLNQTLIQHLTKGEA